MAYQNFAQVRSLSVAENLAFWRDFLGGGDVGKEIRNTRTQIDNLKGLVNSLVADTPAPVPVPTPTPSPGPSTARTPTARPPGRCR